jgi:hypothetical protein
MVLTPKCAAPEYIRHWQGVVDDSAATVCAASADTFCFGVMFARLFGATVFDDNESAIKTLLPPGGTVPASRLVALSVEKQKIVHALCDPDPGSRPTLRSVRTNLVRTQGMSIQASELDSKMREIKADAQMALRCVARRAARVRSE